MREQPDAVAVLEHQVGPRQQLGVVMAGEGDLSEGAVAAFHRAFQWVMLACAACAVLGGIIGLLTAPGKPQKTE